MGAIDLLPNQFLPLILCRVVQERGQEYIFRSDRLALEITLKRLDLLSTELPRDLLTHVSKLGLIDLLKGCLLVPAESIVFVDNCLYIAQSLLLPALGKVREPHVPALLAFNGLRESALVQLRVELHHIEVDEEADEVARVRQE